MAIALRILFAVFMDNPRNHEQEHNKQAKYDQIKWRHFAYYHCWSVSFSLAGISVVVIFEFLSTVNSERNDIPIWYDYCWIQIEILPSRSRYTSIVNTNVQNTETKNSRQPSFMLIICEAWALILALFLSILLLLITVWL